MTNSLTQQRVRLFFWLMFLYDNPALARVRNLFDVHRLQAQVDEMASYQ